MKTKFLSFFIIFTLASFHAKSGTQTSSENKRNELTNLVSLGWNSHNCKYKANLDNDYIVFKCFGPNGSLDKAVYNVYKLNRNSNSKSLTLSKTLSPEDLPLPDYDSQTHFPGFKDLIPYKNYFYAHVLIMPFPYLSGHETSHYIFRLNKNYDIDRSFGQNGVMRAKRDSHAFLKMTILENEDFLLTYKVGWHSMYHCFKNENDHMRNLTGHTNCGKTWKYDYSGKEVEFKNGVNYINAANPYESSKLDTIFSLENRNARAHFNQDRIYVDRYSFTSFEALTNVILPKSYLSAKGRYGGDKSQLIALKEISHDKKNDYIYHIAKKTLEAPYIFRLKVSDSNYAEIDKNFGSEILNDYDQNQIHGVTIPFEDITKNSYLEDEHAFHFFDNSTFMTASMVLLDEYFIKPNVAFLKLCKFLPNGDLDASFHSKGCFTQDISKHVGENDQYNIQISFTENKQERKITTFLFFQNQDSRHNNRIAENKLILIDYYY